MLPTGPQDLVATMLTIKAPNPVPQLQDPHKLTTSSNPTHAVWGLLGPSDPAGLCPNPHRSWGHWPLWAGGFSMAQHTHPHF